MTLTTSTPSGSILEVLRGERTERPPRDTEAATGLRAILEDGLAEARGRFTYSAPLVITVSNVVRRADAIDIARAPIGRLRGALVAQLVRLIAVGHRSDDAFADALAAWLVDQPSRELCSALDDLDADARARLATEVSAHAATLTRALAPVPATWSVRTALRSRLPLAGGSVVLSDVVDLVIGSSTESTASTVLVDVTTSPIGTSTARLLRFHALVHTLRTSVAPWRVALFSTATGELASADVDVTVLGAAVDDVLAVARR